MATELKILGKQDFPAKQKIEFECYLNTVPVDRTLESDSVVGIFAFKGLKTPDQFDVVVLICLDYSCGKDLMYAYNKNEDMSEGYLFIGKWNDGAV